MERSLRRGGGLPLCWLSAVGEKRRRQKREEKNTQGLSDPAGERKKKKEKKRMDIHTWAPQDGGHADVDTSFSQAGFPGEHGGGRATGNGGRVPLRARRRVGDHLLQPVADQLEHFHILQRGLANKHDGHRGGSLIVACNASNDGRRKRMEDEPGTLAWDPPLVERGSGGSEEIPRERQRKETGKGIECDENAVA